MVKGVALSLEVSLNVIDTITRSTGDSMDTVMVVMGESAGMAVADEISTPVKIKSL